MSVLEPHLDQCTSWQSCDRLCSASANFFWRLNAFTHFMMSDLHIHLPTQHWLFSGFWPKPARPPCPTLHIHQISLQLTYFFVFLDKKVLKRKCFADNGRVKQKTAEALKGIKINEFKNCFEQWEKYLNRCIAWNGEYFEGDWSVSM